MYLFNQAQTEELDRMTRQWGLSEIQLMGQAALASFYQLQSDGYFPRDQPLWFLCGSGNNGGDALALAWYCVNSSLPANITDIRIFLPKEGPKTPTSCFYYQLLKDRSHWPCHDLMDFLKEDPPPGTLVIDGLLGTGTKGPLREPYLQVLQKLARHQKKIKVLALDIPSGVGEEGPDVPGLPVPDHVYCFGVPKLSVALHPEIPSSRIRTLTMGFPRELILSLAEKNSSLPLPVLLPEPPLDEVTDLFSKKKNQHKYQAGSGIILGGSPGMEGALLLATRAFFAAGGGLCLSLCPRESSRKSLLLEEPGGIYHDLGISGDFEGPGIFAKARGILLGPGLGPLKSFSPKTRKNFHLLWENLMKQKERDDFFFILDAGFLTHHGSLLNDLRGNNILLTPHRGELSRLGFSFNGKAQEMGPLREFTRQRGHWILVKDSVSVLCGPQGESYVWNQPAPHLAVAGSGDVLGGLLLAAFTRQRSSPLSLPELVQATLKLHGEAHGGKNHPTAYELVKGLHQLFPKRKG